MKKILVSLLVCILLCSMSVSAFAAGAFLSSPSTNKDVVIEEGSFSSDCEGTLICLPYDDRDQLGAAERQELEAAYGEIAADKNLIKLSTDLEAKANKAGVNVAALSVSDLFYLDYTGCADHDGHTYSIQLKSDLLKNFFAVMQYVDGKWIVLENVKVEGDSLSIAAGTYGPVAIVVEADGAPTGDSFPWGYVALMAVSVVGLIVVSVLYKKKSA